MMEIQELSMGVVLHGPLPKKPEFLPGIRRAPNRGYTLSKKETKVALMNALRYVPEEHHEVMAKEFYEELKTYGRIYGYRYRPEGRIYGKPLEDYEGRCTEGKAIQVMMDNNLDFDVALYPYELVTYGETGQVCQNWMQYRLIKSYLEVLESDETLVLESGHPLGIFKSHAMAPRLIITNAMMVGMFDTQEHWHYAMQMGVANYGQMTAGGMMYIGPQGIVHGTFNTILNAGRMKLGLKGEENLEGYLFVSSGLGGMSGAQPKAADIARAVSIVAEVDASRIKTRTDQGWVKEVAETPMEAFRMAEEAMEKKEALSIAFHGNIVDLLSYAVEHHKTIHLLHQASLIHRYLRNLQFHH